jgi:hypothetical protein
MWNMLALHRCFTGFVCLSEEDCLSFCGSYFIFSFHLIYLFFYFCLFQYPNLDEQHKMIFMSITDLCNNPGDKMKLDCMTAVITATCLTEEVGITITSKYQWIVCHSISVCLHITRSSYLSVSVSLCLSVSLSVAIYTITFASIHSVIKTQDIFNEKPML